MRWIVVGALVVSLASGCATRTVITTEPSRAEIYVDGRKAANRTPFSLRDGKSVFATGSATVLIRKEGYADEQIVLNQVADGQCIGTTLAYSVGGGLLLLVPILGLFYLPWCSRFEDESMFVELEPLEDVAAPAPAD